MIFLKNKKKKKMKIKKFKTIEYLENFAKKFVLNLLWELL